MRLRTLLVFFVSWLVTVALGAQYIAPGGTTSGRGLTEEEKMRDGKNVAGSKPPKRDTEKVNGKKVQDAWGELPDYLKKHGRGSMPDVPEKYRKYLEALNKQGHKKK